MFVVYTFASVHHNDRRIVSSGPRRQLPHSKQSRMWQELHRLSKAKPLVYLLSISIGYDLSKRSPGTFCGGSRRLMGCRNVKHFNDHLTVQTQTHSSCSIRYIRVIVEASNVFVCQSLTDCSGLSRPGPGNTLTPKAPKARQRSLSKRQSFHI
jgi:hypothetical protein